MTTDEDLRARIEALELKLPRFGRDPLIARACKQHNQQQRDKAAKLHDLYAEISTVSPRSHPNVVARVCVNYLRGSLEARYPELSGLRGDPARFNLYALAKNKMLSLIALTYPWLSEECERQKV